MKKPLWITVTVIACVLWSVIAALIVTAKSAVTSIVTHSEMQSVSAGSSGPVMLLGWIALIIISMVMWKRWKARCPVCKRWNAVYLMKTEIIKQEDVSVLMELKQRNLNGEVTGTHDQYVPGKRRTYQDTYKCKYCGNLETSTYTKDKASI